MTRTVWEVCSQHEGKFMSDDWCWKSWRTRT